MILLVAIALQSCQRKGTEQAKQEIISIEKAFEKMVADSGIAVAFTHFAAVDGAINRQDSVISGRMAISNFYNPSKSKKISLKWTPDFVDVFSSLDMAYTYGKYTLMTTDSSGQQKTFKGIFHTVWKRQSDGSWKYVWD
jgi:ketosteroid isomerase-like protein